MSESEKQPQPTHNPQRKPKRRRRKPRQARREEGVSSSASTSPAAESPTAPQQTQAALPDVPPVAGKWRFQDFDLPQPLLRAIAEQGFQYCTPIQGESLAYTLLGRDVVGKAQTGTGKTAAFLIAILAYFLEEARPAGQQPSTPRALIIAPTRELALQIEKDAKTLTRHTDITLASLVGGMDYQRQQQQVKGRLDIVIATPGRLLDFQQRGDLDLRQVEVLVLDEADRMLSMGFIPDVKRIIRATPKREERQTFLFSATFTEDILNLSSQWTFEPAYVEIETEMQTADNVEQHVYLVCDQDKERLLSNILKQSGHERVMVFANRRDRVRTLTESLSAEGLNVAMLSGDVPQKQRIRTLEQFREGKVSVLVATDVAGRGIHIDDVNQVINYTLPEDPEDYVHRIGRTGRAGAKGVSISFVGEEDAYALPDIETFIKSKLSCEHPPEGLL